MPERIVPQSESHIYRPTIHQLFDLLREEMRLQIQKDERLVSAEEFAERIDGLKNVRDLVLLVFSQNMQICFADENVHCVEQAIEKMESQGFLSDSFVVGFLNVTGIRACIDFNN